MRENRLQDIFCKKISDELDLFHIRMLTVPPEDIYDSAYEIHTMITLYEVLVELTPEMKSQQLLKMIMFPDILQELYEEWLATEDTEWETMKECVKKAIDKMYSPIQITEDGKEEKKNETFGFSRWFTKRRLA